MKKIFLYLLCVLLINTFGIAQNIYQVPVGTLDNTITIKVTNPTSETIESISLELVSSPEWISFHSESNSVVDLAKENSQNVIFYFNVSEKAPINSEETITFSIKTPDNKSIQKVFKVQAVLPERYELLQNYPNPFNPVTSIKFSLPEDEFVRLKVINLLGETVVILLNEEKKAGSYSLKFDASTLSSGVYFYSIEAGDFKAVRKMLLMK